MGIQGKRREGSWQSLRSALLGIAVVVAGSVIMADVSAAPTGIANTKHNLTPTGPENQFAPTTGVSEICVFCHTPHGADTTASVPLWNRVLGTPASYTTYDSLGTSTTDGRVAPVGSVSIACLSCHDGTQAMNNIINAPGSGGYTPAGALWAGTWTGGAASATPAGSLSNAGIANIGTDLRNDHPIGIQYAGGGYNAGNTGGPGVDPDFQPATTNVIGSGQVWWVDTGTPGRQKTDMVLYSRNEANAASGPGSPGGTITGGLQPYVECGSCHDPHSDNPTFLRLSNANSAVCLACHVK